MLPNCHVFKLLDANANGGHCYTITDSPFIVTRRIQSLDWKPNRNRFSPPRVTQSWALASSERDTSPSLAEGAQKLPPACGLPAQAKCGVSAAATYKRIPASAFPREAQIHYFPIEDQTEKIKSYHIHLLEVKEPGEKTLAV